VSKNRAVGFFYFLFSREKGHCSTVPVRHRHKTGRPTKRTKAVLTPLFEAIRIGVPYKLACMAAGITYDCFNKWRQNDPAFDAQVEQAAAQPAVKLFKTIREQAPETWQSGAWALERRYPEMFAKPEAQLNIVATAQAAAINGTPRNVQMVVVSDLEFVGLKRHPAYVHRPGVVREAEQVPPELAGTLERENRNIIVRSESAAKARARRYAAIHARAKELLDAQGAITAKAPGPVGGELSPDLDGSLYRQDENLVVVSQSKAEAQKSRLGAAQERLEARHNTMPTPDVCASCAHASSQPEPESDQSAPELPDKPAAWWEQFVLAGKLIPKADVTEALRLVLAELRMSVDVRALEFSTDNVVQTSFCRALEKVTGSDLGWRTLVGIYETQRIRERLRADY
jgi:hypothetical protein